MSKQSHIIIEQRAFPLNENFAANCDEADKQERIARAAPALLALVAKLANDSCAEDIIGAEWLENARATITKVTGATK